MEPIYMLASGFAVQGNPAWTQMVNNIVGGLTQPGTSANTQAFNRWCRLYQTGLAPNRTQAGSNANLATRMSQDITTALQNAGIPNSQVADLLTQVQRCAKSGQTAVSQPGQRPPPRRLPPRPMYQPQAPMQPVPLMRLPPPPFSPPVQQVSSMPAPQAPGMPIVVRQMPPPQTVVQQVPWQPPPMPQNWAPPAPPPPAWVPPPPPPVAVTP